MATSSETTAERRPQTKSRKTRTGTWAELLSALDVGDYQYVEVTPGNLDNVSRYLAGNNKAGVLVGRDFSVARFVAVPQSGTAWDVKILLRVTRTT